MQDSVTELRNRTAGKVLVSLYECDIEVKRADSIAKAQEQKFLKEQRYSIKADSLCAAKDTIYKKALAADQVYFKKQERTIHLFQIITAIETAAVLYIIIRK